MNKKILKYNDMKKWNVCLMNPPYGTYGGDDIHYRFTEKCVKICFVFKIYDISS